MDAPWMHVANYFRQLSDEHGPIETAKIREAYRLLGGSRFRLIIAGVTDWDAVFVGACLRLSGYASSGSLNAAGYYSFGDSIRDDPRKGCIVLLRDDGSAGATRVGFLERSGSETVEILEARNDGTVRVSDYKLTSVVGYRWPTETTVLPRDTTLPTVATLSPEDTPLHAKFAMGTIAPLQIGAEYPDFVYWDNTGGVVPQVQIAETGEAVPLMIESLVVRPVQRISGMKAWQPYLRTAPQVRIAPILGGGISVPGEISSGMGSETLEGAAAGVSVGSLQLLGPEIMALQNALTAVDFNVGEIDGVFGRRTRDAVLLAQSQCELPRTGIADDETWQALSVGTMRFPEFEVSTEIGPQPEDLIESGASYGGQGVEGPGVSAPKRIQLYFATTRRPDGDANSANFTDERRRELAFGSIEVSVPPIDSYRIGTLPKLRRIRFLGWTLRLGREDDSKHFVIKGRKRLKRDEFCEAVGKAKDGEALVFVHGFNTAFDDAAYRLAQISSDLQFEGAAVLFAWPSRGRRLGYWYDRESAMFSREAFLELLSILQTDARLRTIHIIAHSMGNQIVVDALATLGGARLRGPLAEVILAAPDVDRDVFCDLGGRIKSHARGVTLYASRADRALQLSRGIAQFPRAGDVPASGPVVVDNVDTIDASAVGSELLSLNHSKYATNRSLIDDLSRLIRSGDRPPNQRSAQIVGIPPIPASPQFWRYRA